MIREDEWLAYYREFRSQCTKTRVRDGCQPRIRTQPKARGSVVLVHGLSDSPHYMVDIADHFYHELGYNVLLPLLQMHGLKDPGGMEGVELEEWKRNVAWAVDQARSLTPKKVSIGGLSTGGALSFYTACTSPKITGDLLLFSAALGLTVKGLGTVGNLVEKMLRSRKLVDFLDKRNEDKPLVYDNPYKYDYVDPDGARELARLIKEIDLLRKNYDRRNNPFPNRVFAAHSHADNTAEIDTIIDLQERTASRNFRAYYIDKKKGVSHGGLVLNHDVVGVHSGKVCTGKNGDFTGMMKALTRFVNRGHTD